MKNLKKVLSLALALVMAMSLMTTAFAADYADIDDVNYTEAVEVMTAVGVFNGMGDNKFAPDATLNRAAAAKLIAYLDLGAEDADALTATGTVFTDVPADYWAAGYIEYMAAAGYTNGTGNDKFSPVATVTGLEFGKWLLTVLGYNAKVEKMTGASWGINTSKLANSINLFDGVSEKAATNLTREAAAAYCLNALQSTCVYYTDLGMDLTLSDGTTINTGADPAQADNRPATNNKGAFTEGDANLQLVEKLFAGELQRNTTVDAFGRPVTNWTYGDFDSSYAETPVATYTNTIKNNVLYADLTKAVVDKMNHYDNRAAGEWAVYTYIDGAKSDGTEDYYSISNTTANVGFATKGATTEIYKDSNTKTITIVVTETYVGKALADYNKNTERVNTTLGFVLQDTDKQDGFEVSDFAKGDYFLYTKVGATTKSLVKAELMTGVVDSYIAGESVVVDGETYYYADNFNNFTTGINKTVSYKLGEAATFVMDGMGNIIAIDSLTEAADDQYVFVEDIFKLISGRNRSLVANIVNTDGTTADDVTISHINGIKITSDTIGDYDTKAEVEDGWYTYTKNGDALKITGDNAKMYYAVAYNGAKLVENGKITIGAGDSTALYKNTKANSATVFIVKDADDEITTYTGIANVPTIEAKASKVATAYYVNGTDGFAKYVYIDLGTVAEADVAATDAEIFYVLGQSGKKVVAGTTDDVKYYTLDVLKDGKIVNVDVIADPSNSTNDAIGTLFYNAAADANNRVTDASSASGLNTYAGAVDCTAGYYVSYSNNVLTLNRGAGVNVIDKPVTDDVAIYVVMFKGCTLMSDKNADYEVLTVTASELAGMLNGYQANFSVEMFDVSTDDDTINTIYVTLNSVVAVG